MADPLSYTGKAAFIVGPEKTATSYLQTLLEIHPDIATPKGIKETFFFERFFDNGVGWYLSRFAPDHEAKHLVETAPGCFARLDACSHIKSVFPDARIIICVRDPVDRAISHYHHMKRYGYLNDSLESCIETRALPIEASRYKKYCRMWDEAFGAENVTVLDMSRLQNDAAGIARDVFKAVGVAPIEVPEEMLLARVNEAAEPTSFALARIATFIANEMKRRGLYKLLEFARRSPIHSMVYGGDAPKRDTISAEMRQDLRTFLADDYAFLKERYGISFDDAPQVDDKINRRDIA